MPSGKTGLGRGLAALIPGAGVGGADEVDIDRVALNPEQPRQRMDEAALDELAASVRAHGLIQPLVVTRHVASGGAVSYQLIAGERRLHAARRAGLQRVPVVVRETTPQGLLELALVENLQRADLGPLEEAQAYRRLVQDFGLSQEAVSQRVGKSRVAVANALRLLGLPDAVKEALASGRITEGHARALLGLADADARIRLCNEVVAGGLTVRETEELVRRLRDEPPAASAAPDPALAPAPAPTPTATRPERRALTPDLAAIEDRLRAALGTQVRLERSRNGGRIVIQFYGDEDLEALLARLLGDDGAEE